MGLTVMPTISINSGGSDVAASGSGGTAVAAGGNDGASTDGSTTVDLSADTPDLSGVATDGSAVLWVDSSSGRQSSRIDSIGGTGDDYVTCQDAFSQTEANRNWGIGGKRATLDNANTRKLLSADAKPGWTIEHEGNETLSNGLLAVAVAGDVTNGFITIRGASGTKRIITQSTNAATFSLNGGHSALRFENFTLVNSNGGSSGIGLLSAGGAPAQPVIVSDCILGDPADTNNLQSGISRTSGNTKWIVEDTDIINCLGDGVAALHGTSGQSQFYGCYIADNGGRGIDATLGGSVPDNDLIVEDCVIEGNALDGVYVTVAGAIFKNNTFHNNGTSSGSNLSFASGYADGAVVRNNQFTAAPNGYGIALASVGDFKSLAICDHNNFGTGGTANANGAVQNGSIGSNSVEVDPQYGSVVGQDFSIGANLSRAGGWPDQDRTLGANQSDTSTYVDIGAAQRQETGGNSVASSYPISVFPITASKVFPIGYETTAQSMFWDGIGVMASLDAKADVLWVFRVPAPLPSGTLKLEFSALANATSGVAKVRPRWVSKAYEENIDVGTGSMFDETVQTLTWSAGDAEVPKELTVTLDADTAVADEFLVLLVTFETTNWTLAQRSFWTARLVWE